MTDAPAMEDSPVEAVARIEALPIERRAEEYERVVDALGERLQTVGGQESLGS